MYKMLDMRRAVNVYNYKVLKLQKAMNIYNYKKFEVWEQWMYVLIKEKLQRAVIVYNYKAVESGEYLQRLWKGIKRCKE